jgi:hypothetical protein
MICGGISNYLYFDLNSFAVDEVGDKTSDQPSDSNSNRDHRKYGCVWMILYIPNQEVYQYVLCVVNLKGIHDAANHGASNGRKPRTNGTYAWLYFILE